MGAHRFIKKSKNSDVIVFSSTDSAMKKVVRVVDSLMREGSDVLRNGQSHLTGVGPLYICRGTDITKITSN